MTHCKDCKWWDGERWLGNEEGDCKRARSTDGLPDDSGSLAWTENDPGYGKSVLLTNADFGCIQFEARGKEDVHDRKFVHRPQLDGGDYEVEA